MLSVTTKEVSANAALFRGAVQWGKYAPTVNAMYKTLKGEKVPDNSKEARLGILLASQFSDLGEVVVNNGKLYLNGVHIGNADIALAYLDQEVDVQKVIIENGATAIFNQILIHAAKSGAIVIKQRLESKGEIRVTNQGVFVGNSIVIEYH